MKNSCTQVPGGKNRGLQKLPSIDRRSAKFISKMKVAVRNGAVFLYNWKSSIVCRPTLKLSLEERGYCAPCNKKNACVHYAGLARAVQPIVTVLGGTVIQTGCRTHTILVMH